jgi:hypothetical protein
VISLDHHGNFVSLVDGNDPIVLVRFEQPTAHYGAAIRPTGASGAAGSLEGVDFTP